MNDNMSSCLCYFHPKEVLVGVCALCLNERLLILASKQEKEKKKKKIIINLQGKNKKKINDDGDEHSRMHYLPKIFALTSFFNRLDIRHSRKETIHDIDLSSTCSYEDSFISIKFENNGVGSWEKGAVGTVPNVSLIKHCDNNIMSNKVALIEHVAKPRMQLRWRKRIGHIFHLIRIKRSSTKGGNASHVGTKLEGVKVRHGWIRTLTKRKTKQ
ncbi:uncharacterized protein LOC129902951 [Solanum dulcamara]|uniref:uncharacterized protein LOC129902951 n=1 Tax=Solanum dulcamara TaxID=45834 RepID=UPI0024855767|nr:uncharacterized protein LOC129902951 [Solanum dulcamara]